MSELLLGKNVKYNSHYNPSLLFPIPRQENRNLLPENILFEGVDIWNCYEVSWLNPKGKPEVRILEIYIPANSQNLVESKSLKLYLNSLNDHKFDSEKDVITTIKTDLEKILETNISIIFRTLDFFNNKEFSKLEGICLDHLDVNIESSRPSSSLLHIENQETVDEKLYSNLLKSNCLITSQPDFASILISYKGSKINHSSLLAYIVSYRNHTEFHEHCAERIYSDIMQQCAPEELTVYARYTRRGGIDINPIRSTLQIKDMENLNYRLARQ